MARTRYDDATKAEALAAYVEHGPAEASRITGIAMGTIASWASRAGVQSVATENKVVRVDGALASLAELKAQLARDLLEDTQRLRGQLYAPCTARKVVVVSDGARDGAHVEIVDVDLTQPSFTDQRAIMTTIAIAVDKVQILTGQATEITEHRHIDQLDAEVRQLTAELEHRATVPA